MAGVLCCADLLQELCWCQHSANAQVLPAQPESSLDKAIICLGLKLQEDQKQHTSKIWSFLFVFLKIWFIKELNPRCVCAHGACACIF